MGESEATRTPLSGSCHCGNVRYVVYLNLPHQPNHGLPPPPSGVQRCYRCNCTICHKIGQFHIRPLAPADDFLLLSPLDPFAELGDYQCFDKVLHFFFCKTCGVRPFIFAGEGEVVDSLDEGAMALNLQIKGSGTQGKPAKVWKPTQGGGHPQFGHYLSVNGHTIDAGQSGFDMREMTEKKQVMYCDCLSDPKNEAPLSYERPQKGGCY